MNYRFPEFIGSFGSSTPNIGAFTGNPISLSSGSGGGSKGGMDPFSAVLGLGSIGASIFGGMNQAQTSASIAQAQFAAQNQAILEGREANKGNIALSMWAPMYQAGTGGELAFERQKRAQEFQFGPLAEKQLGLESERSRRERFARISPESKEAARFENQLAIDRDLAARRAAMEGMFGPIRSSASVA
jgi:hypothetical protein